MKSYHPGSLINDRYEVASHPLMGGMGIVYLCLDREKNIPVALKTFKPEFLPDHTARDLFLREGTAWMDLGGHPNIVRCYGVESINYGTEVFLVLEQVAKEPGYDDASLRSWLTPDNPLSVDRALMFALQIARGMCYANEKIPGFVHRDLKPENVLVGADRLNDSIVNRLRITDFGLAHIVRDNNDQTGKKRKELTSTGDLSVARERTYRLNGIDGTPLYMAPEQWMGEPVSVATDIYALGCIIYEMVAGRTLVIGETATELKYKHLNRKFGRLPNGLPEEIVKTIKSCLSSDSSKRYTDWKQVISVLQNNYQIVTGKTPPDENAAIALSRSEKVVFGWGYSNLGGAYMDIGKPKTALLYFEQAAKTGRAQGESRLEAGAINNLGVTYFELGDIQRAIDNYEYALTIKRESDDQHGLINTLDNLSIAYGKLGDTRRSIKFGEDALLIARKIDDKHAEGRILANLGVTYNNLNDVELALQCFEQALMIDHEIKNLAGEATNLLNIAHANAKQGENARALSRAKESVQIFYQIGNHKAQVAQEFVNKLLLQKSMMLINLGNASKDAGEFQDAANSYESALQISREIGDGRGEAFALGNLGILFSSSGEARRAIEYFEEARVVAYEIENEDVVAINSFCLATTYSKLNDLVRALPLAREAFRIWSQTDDPRTKQVQQLIKELEANAKKTRKRFFG